VYPNAGVDITALQYSIAVTPGAGYEEIKKENVAGQQTDTVFFIKVTSENKQNSKLYAVVQVDEAFPDVFTFENWTKYTSAYLYENPKQDAYQWFSSNNGAGLVYLDPAKPADTYPVKKSLSTGHSGTTAAQLLTVTGPGPIFGDVSVPCMAGSIYLGGFTPLDALRDPLTSTKFGVPFNKGKPLRLQGYYNYKEGKSPYILNDHQTTNDPDSCDIYAVLFKTGDNHPLFLDGNTISTSPSRVALAQIPPSARVSTLGDALLPFDVPFVYFHETDGVYPAFSEADLKNNRYKITIVCSSSNHGSTYQGRPGSCLWIDDLRIVCEQNSEKK
jgi:hypothetical protein